MAAEAKAFLPLGWRPEWDVKSLLDGGWNNDDRTLFKGVQKVRPGHYLMCQGLEHIEQRMYWELDYPDKARAPPALATQNSKYIQHHNGERTDEC